MHSSRYWRHVRGNIIRKRLIIINNLQFIMGSFYKENIALHTAGVREV